MTKCALVSCRELACVALGFAGASLAGCGSAPAPASFGALPAAFSARDARPADALKNILFVSDFGDSEILLYDPDHLAKKPGLIITGIACPGAIALDTAGTLYVANGCGESITEYPLGATAPSFTIPRQMGDTGLAVDSHGNVFVGNEDDNSIDVYASGTTTPFKTFTTCFGPGPFAVDAKDRVWVSCSPGLYVIEPGATSMKKRPRSKVDSSTGYLSIRPARCT